MALSRCVCVCVCVCVFLQSTCENRSPLSAEIFLCVCLSVCVLRDCEIHGCCKKNIFNVSATRDNTRWTQNIVTNRDAGNHTQREERYDPAEVYGIHLSWHPEADNSSNVLRNDDTDLHDSDVTEDFTLTLMVLWNSFLVIFRIKILNISLRVIPLKCIYLGFSQINKCIAKIHFLVSLSTLSNQDFWTP